MDQFAVRRESDALFLRWTPGTRITHLLAVEAALALKHLSDGQTLPLIVTMSGIDGLALKARTGMNAYPGFSAVALIGDSPVDEVLAGFSHQSVTDTRYFTSEEAGLAWLEEASEANATAARAARTRTVMNDEQAEPAA